MCCGDLLMADARTATRDEVVKVALSWLGTPYAHRQMVKGHGVDCATLLIGVYSEVGLVEAFDPGYYSTEWYLHRGEERYLEWLLKYADVVPGPPLPGDVVTFKFGRTDAHTGIVVAQDRFVHAWRGSRAVVVTVMNPFWSSHFSRRLVVRGVL